MIQAHGKGLARGCTLDGTTLKTLEILQYFQPEIWWIENPRGGMLKDRSFMKGIPYIDVDYCQFADWGNQKT